MRRALLLVTVLAPALAGAQNVGEIRLINNRAFPNYVNAAECAGTATIDVRWNASGTGFPAGGVFTLYSTNQAVTTGTCPTAGNTTTGLVVLPVATVTTAAGLVGDAFVSGSQLITGSGGTIASCSSAADQTIYLCVQGTIGGAAFAFATGSVVVSTTSPPPPAIGSATPGDGALNVSWGPGVATTTAPATVQEYSLEATPIPSTADVVHTSGRIGSSPHRFGGLTNGVVYSVRAIAYSIADNPSDPSNAVTGSPQAVRDFWDEYKKDNGRETGGCASGVAGPVGLGILLATLALIRRRK